MRRLLRLVPVPATGIFCAVAVLAWLGEPASPQAWFPGGPDAPEPPLIRIAPLWVLSAVFIGFAILQARRKKPAWATLASPGLAICGLLAAAYLGLNQLLSIPYLSLLPLLGLLAVLRWQMVPLLAGNKQQAADRRYEAAVMGVSLLAGAVALSLAAWTPSFLRAALGFGPSDAPWLSFWVFFINAALISLGTLRRLPRRRAYLLALGWGIGATVWHNWTTSGLHMIALITVFLSAILLARMTWAPKHPKPQA